MKSILKFCLLFLLVNTQVFSQGTQLLRQPTVSSESIVFIYANDLWTVDRDGGEAIRLTTNEGAESAPHFSPDEKWIAFSAQYGGNTDVYVLPSNGGSPKRLTWHSSADIVQGWTPEGEVMFRSSRDARPTQTSKFYKIKLEGGLPEPIEIPRAAYGELSPDGKYIAYTPITGWDEEWRNYRGGQAMPIWIVNMETKDLIRTPQPTKERHLSPIWYKNKVYYLSERDYASNIWSFDPVNKQEEQITFHKKFDVKSLDACNDALVYEQGGYLHLITQESPEAKQLNITVKGDMNFAIPRWEDVAGNQLNNANLSPQGKRAIFEHRGEIFTIPKKDGSWRNLTNSPGVADRSPVWSPKGDKIAWFSDNSGEYQLKIADQFGQNIQQLPLPNPTFYFTPDWSPDGNYIAYTDTDYNIWVLNVSSGVAKKAATDRFAHPNRAMNPVWSPDSKWITYAKQLENSFKAAFVYNVETGSEIQLTDGMADVITPVWDQSGKYLYFLSSTNYGLNTGWLDMSSYDPDTTYNLYCMILDKDTPSPLLLKSDDESVELKSTSETKDTGSKKSKKSKDTVEEKESDNENAVTINAVDLEKRIIPLNMPARNYTGLIRGPENSVFVMESIPNKPGTTLHKYTLKEDKGSEFLSGLSSVTAASNGGHLLYRTGSTWYIVGSKSKPKKGDGALKFSLKIKINPKAEYHQIFKEGWRYMRDFLYVDNVHGAPWDAIFEWYSPWIDHVQHRTDLNYVVDILSGEVAVGHSYVSGGDMPDLNFVPVGLLGCDLIEENGFYRIAKIYSAESWNPSIKAPLDIPGLKVKEGDYLLAVNGIPLKAPTNPYSLFEQTAGKQVFLKVSATPDLATANEIIVEPVSSERSLRSIAWVENNRRTVDRLSGGKLAYVYVPNTGFSGFTSFNRYYFAQQDKKGVIIDERNNGGGSAADYMVDIMARPLYGYFNSKTNDNRPWTTPMAGIWGPKVMLINERAGSGGDLLPYMFNKAKLGPLVGTRTWGGLVGTWDTPRFIDGGRMVAPRGGFFDTDGNWAVEGEGIAPDIAVIQDPKLVLQGIDPQLVKGVETAMELLKNNEFQLKPEPPAPIRSLRPKGFKID
jgi:tricorn protease